MRSKVRTRIESILLIVVMLLSLLPVHALADGPIQVGTGDALTDALTNGGSIQLDDSITVDAKQNWTITKDVVLDLNGHNITSTYGESNYYLMTVRGASLTVTDTSASEAGTISADVSGGYGIQLYSNSTFNLEGGTIISKNETVDIYTITTGCTVNISGGKLVSTADSAMNVRGSGTEVNITDGELVSEGGIAGVFVSSGSSSTDPESIVFNMDGGKLTSTSGPAILTDYALTVNYGGNAVIESENTGISVKGSTVLNVTGGTITADSYALQGRSDSSIHVTDGKIETTRSNLAAVAISDNSTVEVKGGTLVGTKALSGSNEKITIAGGTFQTSSGNKVDVSEYLPEGNTQDENGQVIVDTATAKFAVDGVGHTTLEKALAALKDGSTMTIQPGEYDVTTVRTSKPTYGSSFIIDKKNVTIQAADPNDKPVLYGFSNEFNAGVDSDGINGQDTIYVSGSGVTLKDLVIMPLGGIGPNANNWQKTVEVTSTATGFTMTGCETTPNTHQKDSQDNSMAAASGNIHVSINDADISGNSFGAGTTVSAGWKGSSAADTYSVDVSGNYWGDGVTAADIAGKIDGNVKVDDYYADAGMTELVTVGGTPVSTVDQMEKALTAAKDGDTIVLAPGTYKLTSTLNLNKAVTVTGQAGEAAETILEGPTSVGQTVLLGSGSALKNVTVTRAGNNAEDWDTNANNSGVSFTQNLTAPTTLDNCIITHNRNGVYLNNTGTGTGYAVIKDNQIIDNRTGINMCNNVNNSQITGNIVNNNTTLGIVYYESGFGTNFDTVTLSDNEILGNWYGAINLKTLTVLTTGSLSVGENTIVAAGEQVKVAYEASKEPGYNAQVPSWGGGSATQPAEKPADVILTPNENVEGQTAASIAGLVDYGTLEVAPITVNVHNAAELRNAVVNALPGTVINVYPGDDYDIKPATEPSVQGQGGWYLPITASNITIQGVDENGTPITDAKNTKATIYSTTETKNSNWPTQNLIAVFGDNVAISGLTIMPKVKVNKTIEVNGKNFTLQYCSIVPNSKVTTVEYADPNNGGSLYFAGDKGTEVVKDNYFKQMVLSFDSVDQADSILVENNVFDTPRTDTQMISNVTWTNPPTLKMAPVTIKDNTFKNLPEDYNKVVLQRMEGTFILEDNRLVNADGTFDRRDIADMVSFAATFFKDGSGNVDWNAFVAKEPKIRITGNGVTTVLMPPATEGGEEVTKTVKVTPASAAIYTSANITLAAAWDGGFTSTDAATWTVAPTATLNVSADGKSALFQASQAGRYTVTVTVDDVSASAVITVTNAPVDPVDPSTPSGGGSSSSGDYIVSVNRTTGGKITVSPSRADKGDTVTITVKPDTGYELDKLVVTDKNGDTVKLTNKGDGKYTFTMPGSKVEVAASFVEIVASAPFTDVAESAYYYDAVLWAVANGVTNGTSATTFGPDAPVSRAQMVTFLWRAYGSPKATGTNPFTDVSTSDYYYDAVLWAVANGVTNGTSATTFSPDTAVTRAQAVTFQWRAAGSPVMPGSSFDDVAADAYYANAVTWAVANGITNGTSGTTFSPDVVVSRAQAVTFLWRELA